MSRTTKTSQAHQKSTQPVTPAAKKVPASATRKQATAASSKTTSKQVAKTVEAEQHIADQINVFSNRRVWPD